MSDSQLEPPDKSPDQAPAEHEPAAHEEVPTGQPTPEQVAASGLPAAPAEQPLDAAPPVAQPTLARPTLAQRRALREGVLVGALYALSVFAVFLKLNLLPTMAFLVLVPAALGAVPMLISDDDQVPLYVVFLMRPLFAVIAFLLGAVLIFKEGAVCVIVLALPFLAFAVAGAIGLWVWQAHKLSEAKRKKAALLLAILPFLLAPIEQAYFLRTEELTETSAVTVAAPPGAIWSRLAQVETIQPGEYRPGFFALLGVPRPIRATIDRAALGGHRVGEFEQGLRFDEVIIAWEREREMTFSIAVDPRSLREGSAERHAFETGYFYFRDASYRLEPDATGYTRLTLSSRYVIRSGMNAYGRLWSTALIRDFQERVLEILKARIERDQERLTMR